MSKVKTGRVVALNNIINFEGRFGPGHLKTLFGIIDGFLLGKPDQLIMNFQDCLDAFPNSMLPTISTVARLRSMGYRILATLPRDHTLHQRFTSTNWAHYLSPDQYPLSDDLSEPHLAAHRFTTFHEHFSISKGILDMILKTIDVARSSTEALYWTINELMDNVINHSDSGPGGYAQLAIFPQTKKINFCVADAGRGILASLKEGYPQLQSDRVAIQEAVKGGVTRNKEAGQGNGLSGSLMLAIRTSGLFRVLSGRAEVLWESDMPQAFEYEAEQSLYGTLVDVQLPYSAEINLPKILSESSNSPYYAPLSFEGSDWLDEQYAADDGKCTRLEMYREIDMAGFGSRPTGGQMRIKARNLLASSISLPLVVDWKGVPVVASSYADEFVGKLFVELGPITFMARVRLLNMNEVVQGLLNKAIMQRTQQMMSGGSAY